MCGGFNNHMTINSYTYTMKKVIFSYSLQEVERTYRANMANMANMGHMAHMAMGDFFEVHVNVSFGII